MRRVVLLTAVAAIVSAACGNSPTWPSPPRPAPPPTTSGPAPVRPTLYLGTWVGTSTVEVTSQVPECRPAHWTRGGSEALRVEIASGESSGYHYRLRLIEPLSGTSCELMGTEDTGTLEAWGGVEEPFVTDLDHCHRLVSAATWPCADPKPFVWQVDTLLKINMRGENQDEAQGQLSIRYDHSLGDVWYGPWTIGSVRKAVALARLPESATARQSGSDRHQR